MRRRAILLADGQAGWGQCVCVRKAKEEVTGRKSFQQKDAISTDHQACCWEGKQSTTLTPPTAWQQQSAFFLSSFPHLHLTHKCSGSFLLLTSCGNRKHDVWGFGRPSRISTNVKPKLLCKQKQHSWVGYANDVVRKWAECWLKGQSDIKARASVSPICSSYFHRRKFHLWREKKKCSNQSPSAIFSSLLNMRNRLYVSRVQLL